MLEPLFAEANPKLSEGGGGRTHRKQSLFHHFAITYPQKATQTITRHFHRCTPKYANSCPTTGDFTSLSTPS